MPLVAIFAVVFVAVLAAGTDTAVSINDQAIELATSGKLQASLELFEKAMELEPDNPEYVNNLGVSYMRLNDLKRASRLFKKALDMDPENEDALANIQELNKLRMKQAKSKPVPAKPAKRPPPPKLNPRRPLPVIDIKDLYNVENRLYAEGKRPFKLVNAMKNWPLMGKWSPEWLAKTFPDSIVDFYPHNMDKSDTHPYLTPMHEAISELKSPSGKFPSNKEHPGTYLQWNINLADWKKLAEDWDLPYAFRRDEDWMDECMTTDAIRDEFSKRTHWRMLLLGNEGAGMFNHQDVLRTASWQAQFMGSKKWHICAPDQGRFLYGAGQVDVWDWDYERYPAFVNADCYEDTVVAGEMMFYPRDYWHQTINLETPSASVSGTVCDMNNYDTIADELEAECARQKYRWHFSKQLCTELRQCFALWKERWAPSPAQVPTCAADDDDDEL